MDGHSGYKFLNLISLNYIALAMAGVLLSAWNLDRFLMGRGLGECSVALRTSLCCIPIIGLHINVPSVCCVTFRPGCLAYCTCSVNDYRIYDQMPWNN